MRQTVFADLEEPSQHELARTLWDAGWHFGGWIDRPHRSVVWDTPDGYQVDGNTASSHAERLLRAQVR